MLSTFLAQTAPLMGDKGLSLVGAGLAAIGAGLGAGLSVMGGGRGIGQLAGHAMEGISRQPEAGGRIATNMIIAAALIEGFTFFSLVICLLVVNKIPGF